MPSYTQVVDQNFQLANGAAIPGTVFAITPPNSGGAAGSIAVNNNLLEITSSATGVSSGAAILWTASASRDQRVVAILKGTNSGSNENSPNGVVVRHNGQASNSTTNCYVIALNRSQSRVEIDKVVNGQSSLIFYPGLVNPQGQSNPLPTDDFILDVACHDVNPTNFDITVTNLTNGLVYYTGTSVENPTSDALTTGLAGLVVDGYSNASVAYFGEVKISTGGFGVTVFQVDSTTPPTPSQVTIDYAYSGGTAPFTATITKSYDDGSTWNNLSSPSLNSGTVQDTGVTPGSSPLYRLNVTDSTTPTPNTAQGTVAALVPYTSLKMGFPGDSNFAGNGGNFANGSNPAGYVSGNILPYVSAALTTICPDRSITITDCGLSGSTSSDWNPSSTNIVANGNNCYQQMKANATTFGFTELYFNIGTNDAKYSSSTPYTTPSAYQSNLQAFINQAKTDGFTRIYLGMPISPVQDLPLQGSGTSVPAIIAYRAIQLGLCDGVTVFPGDGKAFGYYANQTGNNAVFNGLHVEGGAGGQEIATLVAAAICHGEGWLGTQVAGGSGGTSINPGNTHVQSGITYEINGTSFTGTYDPVTNNYTDPGVNNVASGTTYKFAGTTETGTYAGGSGSSLTYSGIASAVTSAMATSPVGSVAATVNLNLGQTVPNNNTAGTVGETLCAARAEAFGKVVYDPVGKTFTVYGPDNTTVIKAFNVTTDSNGNILSRV